MTDTTKQNTTNPTTTNQGETTMTDHAGTPTHKATIWVAVLHVIGTEQDEDHVGAGATAEEATAKAIEAIAEAWDDNDDQEEAKGEVETAIEDGDIAIYIHQA